MLGLDDKLKCHNIFDEIPDNIIVKVLQKWLLLSDKYHQLCE